MQMSVPHQKLWNFSTAPQEQPVLTGQSNDGITFKFNELYRYL